VGRFIDSARHRSRLPVQRVLAGVLGACAIALFTGCAGRPEVPLYRVAPDGSGAAPPSIALAVDADRVETLDFEWFDPARARTVPVRAYLPRPSVGPVPLVVFSHGMGGSRFGYTYLGRYLAAQGFASLHVQHAGSDRSVWTSGGWNVVASLHAAASEENALARAEDVTFVITRSLAEPALAGRLRAGAIAVAGHSYGANTALLVGGATVDRRGRMLSRHDPRVRALVLISAPPIHGEENLESVLAPVRVPSLHLTGTQDVIRIPGYFSDLGDRIAIFKAVGSSPKALIVFNGANHSIFTDRFGAAQPELTTAVRQATREAVVLFLRSVLLGEAVDALERWRGEVGARDGNRLIERFELAAPPTRQAAGGQDGAS